MLYENRETAEILTENDMREEYKKWSELADYDSYEDFLSAVTDSNGLYIAHDMDENSKFRYYEDKKVYTMDRLIKDYRHALKTTDFMNFAHFIEHITDKHIYILYI